MRILGSKALLPLLFLVLVGCNDGESTASADTANPADAAGDAASADTAKAPDSTVSQDATVEPFFEIGQNPQFESSAASYTPLSDPPELELEFGAQGSWMTVLAFKSRGIFTSSVTISGRLELADGTLLGELTLVGREFFFGGDGFNYYFSFFLAILIPDALGSIDGEAGRLILSIEDEGGHSINETIALTFRGGP